MLKSTVADKALRLTGAFEGHGGGVAAGNFDGQTLTWGDLGFNIGQGTLPWVFRRIITLDEVGFAQMMGRPLLEAAKASKQVLTAFVVGNVLDAREMVLKEWQTRFMRLYLLSASKQAIREASQRYLDLGAQIARRYHFKTERGFCLGFDISVQNGSVRPKAREAFEADPESKSTEEWQRLRAMAKAVAGASLPQWQADVLSRKLCIAVGQGTVHGRFYRLLSEYGIDYAKEWAAV